MDRLSLLLVPLIAKWHISCQTLGKTLRMWLHLEKENHLLKAEKCNGKKRTLMNYSMPCYSAEGVPTIHIFHAYVLVYVFVMHTHEHDCKWEKDRKKIWWIVSYMASINGSVIYGVNNWVYSRACSVVVFLLCWDDRNTMAKPPICPVPSSFKNL